MRKETELKDMISSLEKEVTQIEDSIQALLDEHSTDFDTSYWVSLLNKDVSACKTAISYLSWVLEEE